MANSYTRSGRQNPNGPSKKTRRIITISLAAVLLIVIIALVVKGVQRSSADKQNAGSSVTNSAVSASGENSASGNGTTAADKDSTSSDSSSKTGTKSSQKTTAAASGSVSKEGLFSPSSSYRNKYRYCVAVNTAQNMVIIYGKDEAGNYTKAVRAFVCSCGKASSPTKLGTFYTSDKERWGQLYGGVWGQYLTRITGPYLFHSVPYYSEDPSDLEYNEYNKLGHNASAGCVRLCVRDVKWIYENLPSGTMVKIYKSTKTEPLSKPSAVTIDTSSANRGWDPTDPDTNNPWNA